MPAPRWPGHSARCLYLNNQECKIDSIGRSARSALTDRKPVRANWPCRCDRDCPWGWGRHTRQIRLSPSIRHPKSKIQNPKIQTHLSRPIPAGRSRLAQFLAPHPAVSWESWVVTDAGPTVRLPGEHNAAAELIGMGWISVAFAADQQRAEAAEAGQQRRRRFWNRRMEGEIRGDAICIAGSGGDLERCQRIGEC